MEAGALAFVSDRALSCRPAPLQKTGPVQIFRKFIFLAAPGPMRALGRTKMAVPHDAHAHAQVHARPTPHRGALHRPAGDSLILPGVAVRREGRIEPFLAAHPTLSSADVRWSGLALEDYSVPALVIPKHEHVENFVHVVLRGSAKYQVSTRGKTLEFSSEPRHHIHLAPRHGR